MSFDLKRMIESKKTLRRKLASRPLAEKLAMLDALRERTLALREAGDHIRHSAVHETSGKYCLDKIKKNVQSTDLGR